MAPPNSAEYWPHLAADALGYPPAETLTIVRNVRTIFAWQSGNILKVSAETWEITNPLPIRGGNIMNNDVAVIEGGLVVSCQASAESPLNDPSSIAKLSQCAALGGAVGLRINSPANVAAVKGIVNLPIIGIYKTEDNRITPTWELAREVALAGADIIAFEATSSCYLPVSEMIAPIQDAIGLPVMADIGTVEQGIAAWDAGADLVATTMSGYVPGSPAQSDPDLELISTLAKRGIRVVGEGRFATAEHVRAAFNSGAYSIVIGTAITNPIALTKGFASATARPG